MPRKNNRKVQPQFHGASIYDSGFKAECYGCAFAGSGFKCLTSDGKCLKVKPSNKERDYADDTVRTG